MNEEINVISRSKLEIVDLTDENKPRTIISAIISNDIPEINTTHSTNSERTKND